MAIIEDMSKEDFIALYEKYTEDTFTETERHNKELQAISEKYADFIDTLYEKMLLKFDTVLERDAQEIEKWMNETIENRPDKIVEDPDGKKLIFVNREDDDDLPENLHLLTALADDNIEITFEPAGKEILKAYLFFVDTKRIDERFFKVSELAELNFPEGYFEEEFEEED